MAVAAYYGEVRLSESINMVVRLEEVEGSDATPDVWDHPIRSLLIEYYPCPTGWVMKHTDEDRYYFQNTVTGSKTVSLPSPEELDLKGRRLPHLWKRVQRDGQVIYINIKTKATQYCSPLYQGEKMIWHPFQGAMMSYDPEANLELTDYLFFESF